MSDLAVNLLRKAPIIGRGEDADAFRERQDVWLREVGSIHSKTPRQPITLEMRRASYQHTKWERRREALLRMCASDNARFVDSEGEWCLRDFIDYVGETWGLK